MFRGPHFLFGSCGACLWHAQYFSGILGWLGQGGLPVAPRFAVVSCGDDVLWLVSNLFFFPLPLFLSSVLFFSPARLRFFCSSLLLSSLFPFFPLSFYKFRLKHSFNTKSMYVFTYV